MVLGSDVIVDNPSNPKIIARLQVRNMRVTVDNQTATMQMELFRRDQPVESYNSSIVAPVKPIHEIYEEQIEKLKVELKPTTYRILSYTNDLVKLGYKKHAYITTRTYRRYNYLTGIGE